MAVKNGADSLRDKLRKLFMTRDSDAFEKTLSEEVKDEGMEGGEGQHIHIHMPGGEKAAAESTTDEPAAAEDPMAKCMAAIESVAQAVAAIGDRVAKLETPATTDDDPAADPASDPGADPATTDADPEPENKDKPTKTADSASFRDEFQDAKARAEILAPGVKLPTFDAKAEGKKTADSICVLRRRALRAALDNSNADIVRAIVGTADVSKMTCDAAKMAFHASSELVKQKNSRVGLRTNDAAPEAKDINQIHADFWANRK